MNNLNNFIRNAKKLGINTQSNKRNKHLRLKCPNGDYIETLKKVVPIPFDIEQSLENYSTAYCTFDVTLKDSGDKFIYVPTTRTLKNPHAFISDKQLVPVNLIDTTKYYTESELYSETLNGINKIQNTKIKTFLKSLCESIMQKSQIDYSTIDYTDLTRIFKDFGEILSALNSFSAYSLDYVKFSERSNEILIDFIGYNDHITYFSAKSNFGMSTSFKNIQNLIDSSDDSIYNKLLKIFSDDTKILEKIIKSCEIIDPNALEILRNDINADVTVENLEMYCREHIFELDSTLKNFYDKINRSYHKDSLDKMQTRCKKYAGFVLSPLGYHIVDCLNSDKNYREQLNKVLNQSEIVQVNLFFKNNIEFKYTKFDNANFKFDYHNNALNANGNNFGFKIC